MLQRHGWGLLGHTLLLDQIDKLTAAAERARQSDPSGWQGNANVKLLAALRDMMLGRVPRDPLDAAFRQGNTLGPAHRHWFRAKFGGSRFRLFFRADSVARVVVYVWVNDRDTLRKAGAASDPYAVFVHPAHALVTRRMCASDLRPNFPPLKSGVRGCRQDHPDGVFLFG